jgi:hypothetical protein
MKKASPYPHGTLSTSRHISCHCIPCRRVGAEYQRKLRKRHRELGLCWECNEESLDRVRCPKHASALARRRREVAR